MEKFVKICPKITVFQIFDKFFQISVPLTGTPQSNRWDKFWTNLGFRAFLKAVRGKRVRKINSPNIFSGNHRLPITDFSGNCSKLIPPENFSGNRVTDISGNHWSSPVRPGQTFR